MAGNYRTVIKRFSDNYFSVTQLKHKVSSMRTKLPDFLDNPPIDPALFDPTEESLQAQAEVEKDIKERKFKESLIRSRTRIFEIAMCNDWELFATFTIDPSKYDRYHLKDFYKAFSQYVSNHNKRRKTTIKYLLIPEMHEDGAWHLHGMFMGLPEKWLRRFHLGTTEKLPRYIRSKLFIGQKVFDWPGYRKLFGFCNLEPIRNKEACCKYIVKYITKDLDRSVKELGAKVYYCSQGLKRPLVVFEGEEYEKIAMPDFYNIWMDRKDFFTFASAFEFANVQFFNSFIEAGLDETTIEKILSA